MAVREFEVTFLIELEHEQGESEEEFMLFVRQVIQEELPVGYVFDMKERI